MQTARSNEHVTVGPGCSARESMVVEEQVGGKSRKDWTGEWAVQGAVLEGEDAAESHSEILPLGKSEKTILLD